MSRGEHGANCLQLRVVKRGCAALVRARAGRGNTRGAPRTARYRPAIAAALELSVRQIAVALGVNISRDCHPLAIGVRYPSRTGVPVS
jgi:hypothetical protein